MDSNKINFLKATDEDVKNIFQKLQEMGKKKTSTVSRNICFQLGHFINFST